MLPELEAIQAIADIISPLTPAERRRVAAWLGAYAGEGAADADGAYGALAGAGEATAVEGAEAPASPMESFEALYAAVAPRTNAQKASVAAYWLERQEGLESWSTHNVNKLLKSIGTKVSSLSIVLSNEVKSKSPKVALLDKQGDSMQARKSFVLTQEGVDYVEACLG